jgi:hypothetical protein
VARSVFRVIRISFEERFVTCLTETVGIAESVVRHGPLAIGLVVTDAAGKELRAHLVLAQELASGAQGNRQPQSDDLDLGNLHFQSSSAEFLTAAWLIKAMPRLNLMVPMLVIFMDNAPLSTSEE